MYLLWLFHFLHSDSYHMNQNRLLSWLFKPQSLNLWTTANTSTRIWENPVFTFQEPLASPWSWVASARRQRARGRDRRSRKSNLDAKPFQEKWSLMGEERHLARWGWGELCLWESRTPVSAWVFSVKEKLHQTKLSRLRRLYSKLWQ